MGSNTSDRTVELLADGLHFPEGPRWHDGRLYVSDFFDRAVYAYAPDGSRTVVCEVPEQPSGLGFLPDGDLLVVSMGDCRVLRLHDGELREHADLSAYAGGHCNDMLVDAQGRAWVGNFGSEVTSEPIVPTRLVRVDPDGSATPVGEEIVFPNGTVITADGTLLVAESFAFRISAFDVEADGSLTNRRLWADFGPGPAHDVPQVLATDALVPDGMCLDAEGALWVADAGGRGAVRVTEGGEILETVAMGELTAFAVALGGEDGRTLFLCAGPPLGQIDPSAERRGALMTCRVDVPGAAWA